MRFLIPYGTVEVESCSCALPSAFAVVLPITRAIGIASVVDLFCPLSERALLSHGQVVEAMVLQILDTQRRVPLSKFEQWAQRSHIEALYGQPAERFGDDRLGRALDAISEHIAEIETAVVSVAVQRFTIDARRIHWDLTNVTFAAARDTSELVCCGYGAGQLHERQVQVGLNTTAEGGIPVRHETLPGSINQTPLGPQMLADLQRRLRRSDLIIVSDRAGLCYDTITAYRAAKAHFVGPLQARAAQQAVIEAAPLEAFVELSYRSMNAPEDRSRAWPTTVSIGCADRAKPPLQVNALVIHSDNKARDDAKNRDKKLERARQRLAEIGRYLNKGRYARADYARRQIEKAIPKSIETIVRWELSGGDKELSLRSWTDPDALAAAIATQGRYLLVYDLPGKPTPDEVFEMFKGQHQIEARFRNLGSDLQINPVWLHNDNRIAALVLIFILALMVYTLLELCSVRAGLEGAKYRKLTARAILEQMKGILLQVVQPRGSPPQRALQLPLEVTDLLHRLRFPDPITYII